jgi:hypothetical protein
MRRTQTAAPRCLGIRSLIFARAIRGIALNIPTPITIDHQSQDAL